MIVTPETKPEEKQAPVLVPRETRAPVTATGNPLCLDFETFLSPRTATRSKASKMTTEAYVRDPRFAATCLGYAYYANDTLMNGWIGRHEIKEFLSGEYFSTCQQCTI